MRPAGQLGARVVVSGTAAAAPWRLWLQGRCGHTPRGGAGWAGADGPGLPWLCGPDACARTATSPSQRHSPPPPAVGMGVSCGSACQACACRPNQGHQLRSLSGQPPVHAPPPTPVCAPPPPLSCLVRATCLPLGAGPGRWPASPRCSSRTTKSAAGAVGGCGCPGARARLLHPRAHVRTRMHACMACALSCLNVATQRGGGGSAIVLRLARAAACALAALHGAWGLCMVWVCCCAPPQMLAEAPSCHVTTHLGRTAMSRCAPPERLLPRHALPTTHSPPLPLPRDLPHGMGCMPPACLPAASLRSGANGRRTGCRPSHWWRCPATRCAAAFPPASAC